MAVLPGCGLILDFDPWPPAPVDAGMPDAARIMDAGPETMRDAFLADAPAVRPDADGSLADADVTEAGLEDGGLADAGTDAGSPAGCADDSIEQRYPGEPDAGLGEMVGCDGIQDQCTAQTLCAPGWHLCTPTEYEARGGGTMPATALRWLAGCMRRGDCSVTLGAATVCGDCTAETGAPLAIFGNACPGVTRLESVHCPVGVTTSTMPGPYRLDGFPACMHAEVATTDVLLGATCCR